MKKFLQHLLWKYVTQDPEYPEVPMSCPEISIDQVDQALYDKLLGEAQAAGVKFDGDTVTFEGCTFDWLYDSAAQVLHVTCTTKPLLVGCGYIEGKIQELVTKARQGI